MPGTREDILRLIDCPGCGYDLRGLSAGRRCPECGFAYGEHTFSLAMRAPLSMLQGMMMIILALIMAIVAGAFVVLFATRLGISLAGLLETLRVFSIVVVFVLQMWWFWSRYTRVNRFTVLFNDRGVATRLRKHWSAILPYGEISGHSLERTWRPQEHRLKLLTRLTPITSIAWVDGVLRMTDAEVQTLLAEIRRRLDEAASGEPES